MGLQPPIDDGRRRGGRRGTRAQGCGGRNMRTTLLSIRYKCIVDCHRSRPGSGLRLRLPGSGLGASHFPQGTTDLAQLRFGGKADLTRPVINRRVTKGAAADAATPARLTSASRERQQPGTMRRRRRRRRAAPEGDRPTSAPENRRTNRPPSRCRARRRRDFIRPAVSAAESAMTGIAYADHASPRCPARDEPVAQARSAPIAIVSAIARTRRPAATSLLEMLARPEQVDDGGNRRRRLQRRRL